MKTKKIVISVLVVVSIACAVFLLTIVKTYEYQISYNRLVNDMLDESVKVEECGNLIIKVWHNAIYNINDEETDMHTKVNNVFVSDFNDALNSLFSDEGFGNRITDLQTRQAEIKMEMKDMTNIPKGFDNAYKALEEMYNSYIVFSNAVIYCEGSLESFTEDFTSADDDLVEKYHVAELFVK